VRRGRVVHIAPDRESASVGSTSRDEISDVSQCHTDTRFERRLSTASNTTKRRSSNGDDDDNDDDNNHDDGGEGGGGGE
jgi:hypothetical protein